MTKRTRLTKDARREQILAAAMKLAAQKGGLATLTRLNVATAAGCTEGNVSLHFGTMTNFKRDIMRAALQEPHRSTHLSIIAQGLASGDATLRRQALKAPEEVRTAAANCLAGV